MSKKTWQSYIWLCVLAISILGAGHALAGTSFSVKTTGQGSFALEYIDGGAGPAVVMLASLGRSARDFDDLASRVQARGFRVLRPEPRGIGASAGIDRDASLEDLAQDVLRILKAENITSFVLIGHAFGNRLARMVSVLAPDQTRAVILLAAGGKVESLPGIRATLRACFDESLSDEEHLKSVKAAFFADGHDPTVWRSGWYPAVAQMQGAAGQKTPVEKWWTGGTARILVVQPADDVVAPPGNAAALLADIGSRARVLTIKNAGHALLPEQPDEVARAVVQFLDEVF